MAYNFTRASNHRIEVAGLADFTSQFSLSVWVKNASAVAGGGATEHRMVFVKYKDSTDRNIELRYSNNGGTTGPTIAWTQPTSTFIQYQAGGVFLTTGQWYHFLIAIDWTTNPDTVVLYQDSVSQTLTRTGSDNATPTTGATQIARIGGLLDNASFAWDGDIAELAIWPALLTADEAKALHRGASPLIVHPNDLELYAPLVRDLVDVAGHALTNQGATVSTHPAVINP